MFQVVGGPLQSIDAADLFVDVPMAVPLHAQSFVGVEAHDRPVGAEAGDQARLEMPGVADDQQGGLQSL